MKDTHLLPYILPNIFAISQILSSSQFAVLVLPSLKPLFAIKEPPQNMLTLLDNLQMLQDKTDKPVFRERQWCSECGYERCLMVLCRRPSARVQRLGE